MALRAHDLAKDLPTVAATLATEVGRDVLLKAMSTAPSATSSASLIGVEAGGALGSSTGGGGKEPSG